MEVMNNSNIPNPIYILEYKLHQDFLRYMKKF
jgi:hypothetical protein